ncbi:MAG: hypothetical protein OEL55_05765, partial [Desulfobulbaceae bacterium]|nr:hypothetical protein [Desulfobulbaceae bacterium]
TIKTWTSQSSGGVDVVVPGQAGSFMSQFSALQYSHHSLQMTAERVSMPMGMANFIPPEVYGDIGLPVATDADDLSRSADNLQYQSLNRLVLAEYRRVTLEIFTQKSTAAKNEDAQKLDMLGKDFVDFIDKLGAKTREA